MASMRTPMTVPGLGAVGAGPPFVMAGGQRMLGTPLNPGPDGRASVFAAGSTLGTALANGVAPTGGATTSISTVTMGFGANETVNKEYKLRRYRNGIETKAVRGDLYFMRRSKHADSNLYTAATLQDLNYFLELNLLRALLDADNDELDEDQQGLRREDLTGDWFFNNWNFVGILQGIDGGRKRSTRALSDIVANVTVGGFQQMPNAFGNNVRLGTKLYGIVRQKAFSSPVMIDPEGYKIGAVRDVNHRALQIDLFGDYRFAEPPPDMYHYRDEHNRLQKSHIFFIGTAQDNGHVVNELHRIDAMRSRTRYVGLSPPFTVAVKA